MEQTIKIGLFSVHYDGKSVVTAFADVIGRWTFEDVLGEGQRVRDHFKSRGGTDWGCDGVGYGCQKAVGQVRLCRSGVGPVNFKRGIAACLRAVR